MKQRRPLDEVHKHYIASEIARHVVVAADGRDPMQRIARFLIDSLLWCWTADGIDDEGIAKRDLLKYDFDCQRHTESAWRRFEETGLTAGLRHEHAVPRKVLISTLLRERPTAHEVYDILSVLCFGVVMTKEQDLSINKAGFRDAMPFEVGRHTPAEKLLARYEHFKVDVRPPRRVVSKGSGDARPGE